MDASISLYRKIRRLYRLGQRYSMNHRTQGDLSPSEFQLLRHVGFHGEVSQRHLAEDLSVDKAMITRTLQKLEAKGYLVRVEDAKDGRSKKVIALPAAKRDPSGGPGTGRAVFRYPDRGIFQRRAADPRPAFGRYGRPGESAP